jgi:hypothetical protein
MNLDISTSIDFVITRTEKTSAVQATLAALPTDPWVWPSKTTAAWVADVEQLDGAKTGTLAHRATAAVTDKSIQFAALDARYNSLHTRTLQAVGVMRSRALADLMLRPVVDELSARGDSNRAIEEEGEELLAAWSQEFGENFVPAPGNTYETFKALYEGAVTVPTLRKLKSNYKESVPAKRTPPPKACPASGKPWKNSLVNHTHLQPRRLASSSLMANLIALFYNGWSLYLRFYDEGHHREAIRTRPMLMSGVGRQVQGGGQRTVKVSILHEKGDVIAKTVTQISKELHQIRAITERWTVDQRWTLLLTRLLRRRARWKMAPRPTKRSRITTQRMKINPKFHAPPRPETPRKKALHEHAHFPF